MDDKYKAKKAAIQKMKEVMSRMGGDSLMGGLSAEVVAKDPESLKEGLEEAAEVVDESELEYEDEMDYSELSKEELIELLKNKM